MAKRFKQGKRSQRYNDSGTRLKGAFGLIGLGILFLIAFVIELSQRLFPIFVVLTALTGILLLLSLVISRFKIQKPVRYIGIAFGVLIILCAITYVVGPVIGNSSFGLSITNITEQILPVSKNIL